MSDVLVAPDIVALLESQPDSRDHRPGSHPMPIEAARQQHEDDVKRFSPPAGRDEVGSVSDLSIPVSHGTLAALIYQPAASPAAVMVWIHGGGWVTGSTETADVVARALCARSDLTVVSIPYRLAPEHPWPQGLDDARDATEWVLRNPLGGGDVPLPVLVGGDSAGGNLAAVIALELGSAALAAQVLIYPVIALDEAQDAYASRLDNATGYYVEWSDVAWAIDNYASPEVRSEPRVSPMRAADAGGAPAIIAVAGFDPLRDEGVAYARWLEQGNVSVDLLGFPTLLHGAFDMIGRSPSADRAMTAVADAITRRLGR